MDKRVCISYVTFARDIEWMRYSLESLRKYGSGFAGVTIVVPVWDVEKFLQFERYSTKECPVLIKNFLEYPGKGFVHHLAMKCYADVFQPDATHILHMDPDCLFSSPVTPEDYFVEDKPVLVIEPYEGLKERHPARFNWKRVTENALKFDCTHETMCRHPAVHVKSAYRKLRDYMESIHLTPFYDFVIKQQNRYPQGFGEFNTIGAYVMKYMSELYHFVDLADLPMPEAKVWQGWSYTGAHADQNMAEIKKILG